jgi:hypothetical protein
MATTTTPRKPRAAKPTAAPETKPTSIVLASDKWRDIFKKLLPTVNIKEPLHYSGGFLLQNGSFVSTEGHALTVLTFKGLEFDGEVLLSAAWIKQVLIPILPTALLEVAEVTLSRRGEDWLFEWEGVSLKAKIIAAKYPDWRKALDGIDQKGESPTITLGSGLLQSVMGPDTRSRDQEAYARFYLDTNDPHKPCVVQYSAAVGDSFKRIIMPIRMD